MAKIGFKISLCLAFWLFSVQIHPGFASISEAVQVEEDSGSEVKQSPGPGLAYIDQRNSLRIEPGPQKEYPLFFSAFLAASSGSLEARQENSALYGLFLRDVRHSLTIQIFPFHFFW